MKTNYLFKRLSLILSFIVLMGYSASACNYSLHMVDSYGDGWNGGTLTVSVNGTAVITNLTMANGSTLDTSFAVVTGDVISTSYTGGSYMSENSYTIMNAIGVVVANQTSSSSGPANITSLVVACPIALDAAMVEILVPAYNGLQTVKGVIKNNGSTTLTSASISWSIDGAAQTAATFSGSIATSVTDTVTLGSYTFTQGSHTIVASSSAPNGGADGNTANDTVTFTTNFDLVISSFPYNQDFENAGSIPTDWINDANDAGGDWQFVTANSHGPANDHTTGSGYYALLNDYSISTSSSPFYMLSPAFDLSSSGVTYNLSYQYWIGPNAASNPIAVEVSTDGGATWTVAFTHDLTVTGAWAQNTISLASYNMSNVIIRFKGVSIYGYSTDNSGIDDFTIYEVVPNDVKIEEVFGDFFAFETGDFDVTAVVNNNGTADQTNLTVSYSLDNGTPVTTTIAALNAGMSDTITFSTPVNTTIGTHDLIVYTSLANDQNTTNDSVSKVVEYANLPYAEDFDSYVSYAIPNHWSVVNTTGAASASAYAYNYAYYAHSGANTMKLYNYNASTGDLIAVLPRVFGGISTKVMKFWLRSPVNASVVVGVLTDPNDASTFVGVDTITSATSSYAQYAVNFSNYAGSGMFIGIKHGLAANYQSLYIDDIELYEPQPNEMMMLSWDAPLSSIEFDTANIVVSVYNNGIAAQSNIPVAYSTDGGTTIVYDTINTTVNPGDTFQFTFSTAAVFASGVNDCGAVVSNGDAVPANDTVFYEMTNFTMPYVEGFESCANNAIADGWNQLNTTGSASAYTHAYLSSYSSHNGNLSYKLYNYNITNGDLMAVMPYYGGTTLTDKWIKFWHRGYTTASVIVGVLSDPNDASTFVAVDTILPATNSTYNQYSVSFTNYAGSGKYIAFKHGMEATYKTLLIDDIVLEVAPLGAVFEVAPDTNFTFPAVRYNYADTLDQIFTITNGGIGNMSVTAPILGGLNDTNFVLIDTNTYPKSLASFESLSFKVRFGGSSIGMRSANLAVTYNGVNDTIQLNGPVVDPIISSFPYVENFDDQALDLGWSLQGGAYKWMYDNDQTGSSNTGPMGDVTGGYYIYTEASSGSAGAVASIYTNPIDMSSLSNAKLNFWYHMYGATIDTLSIELAQNGTWTVVDTLIGQQQSSLSAPWLMRSVDLSAYASTLIDSIRFKAIRGTSYTGDIAIDNIALGEDMMIDLGADTATCDSLYITLDAGMGATPWTYKWVDLATGSVVGTAQTYDALATGAYVVNVQDEGYFVGSDTINVLIASKPTPVMSPDVSICEGDSTVISAGSVMAAPGVFFSEYIEGSGNNKALEIYNGTSATINLDEYSIMTNYNGNAWSGQYHFPAGATLATGDVFVIANENADNAILAVADDTLAYNAGGYVVGFNGDDVRALYHHTSVTDSAMVDIIGAYDLVDPGAGWDVAGVSNGTKDHSLIRKSTVIGGDTSWAAIAGTDSLSSQYIVYAKNDFSYIGSHTATIPTTLTYLWSNGETAPVITVMPTTTTTYTVIVDNGNCQETDSVVVTVNALPVVNLGNDTTIKWTAGTVTLDAGNPNAAWMWNTGSTTQTETFDNTNLTNGTANTVYVTVTENGCVGSDTLVITVMDDVSINGALDDMELNVYPNPTKGQFNMAIEGFEGELTMNIVNLAGQVVYTEVINVTPSYVNKFDVSTLSTGVYYIKLTTENGVKVLKLVIR
jgi:hypothetical protein